jgi:hypothetical protein
MTASQKSNKRFIMREAHKLVKETIIEGESYMANLSGAISIISKRMKATKKVTSPAKNYMGGICTKEQYDTLVAIAARRGKEMKKTRFQINNVQARAWIAQYGY